MKNESWVQTLKDYVMLTVGTLLIAIGVYFFKFPNHFSTGGVSGISIILAHYAPNLSAGAFVFIINMAAAGAGLFRIRALFRGAHGLYQPGLVLRYVGAGIHCAHGCAHDQPTPA